MKNIIPEKPSVYAVLLKSNKKVTENFTKRVYNLA